jgi:tRNA pseudouridine38-40 synthase
VNFHVKPHKIAIIEAEVVADDFHARFSARERSYVYRIINRRAPLTFEADRAWLVQRPLELASMRQAADLLIGQHDFSTFRAQNCQANSPIRTLDQLDITRDNDQLTFTIRARSFLYHQVRNMVGTLVMIGTGQWSLDDFKTAFAARDRRAGGPTAPPQGLYFRSVTYPS